MIKIFGIFVLFTCMLYASPVLGEGKKKNNQSIQQRGKSIDFSGLQVPFPSKSSKENKAAKLVQYSITELSDNVFDGKIKKLHRWNSLIDK